MSNKKHISQESASKIKSIRKKAPSVKVITAALLNGDKTALGRAITVIESTKDTDRQKAKKIIESCLSQKNHSIRIGITGPPGVGKSTFIEAFGKHLTALDKKVAVLAIDPSSTLTKGSILGDKTRMQELVKDDKAFVRPSPSGTSLGGVAEKTRETILVCEAAGYEIILVETVGVGQSEIAVHSMVDFFLVLQQSGAGDELQGIKRGIIEMADAMVINKADGDNLKKSQLAKTELLRALHLFPPKESGWIPKVILCSSIEKTGLKEIWEMISEYITKTKDLGEFNKKRQEQNSQWFLQAIQNRLKSHFLENKKMKQLLDTLLIEVAQNKISASHATDELFQRYLKELK